MKRRFAPRPGGVVDAHGVVRGQPVVEAAGGLERDLPHGHTQVGTRTGQIDAAGCEAAAAGAAPVAPFVAAVEGSVLGMIGRRRKYAARAAGVSTPPRRSGGAGDPYGGMTRIRFGG